MKRNPKESFMLGTVSHGTLRSCDLIEAFIDALDALGSMPKDERALVRDAKRALKSGDADAQAEAVETLTDLLSDRCPQYVYFGAHEGDASDFGFWVSHDSIDEDVYSGHLLRVDDLSKVPKDWTNPVVVVNDHGNMTMYARKKHGKYYRCVELWSVV